MTEAASEPSTTRWQSRWQKEWPPDHGGKAVDIDVQGSSKMIPSGSASVEMLAIMIPANSSIVGKKTLDSRGGTARRSGKFVGMSSPFKPPR